MCDFCENIPTNDEEFEKKRDEDYNADFIFKAECGFGVYVNTGDSFQPGILTEIAYCPMCGRKLSEETGKSSTEEILTRLKEKMTEGDYRTLQNGIKLFSDGVNALWSVSGKRIDEND